MIKLFMLTMMLFTVYSMNVQHPAHPAKNLTANTDHIFEFYSKSNKKHTLIYDINTKHYQYLINGVITLNEVMLQLDWTNVLKIQGLPPNEKNQTTVISFKIKQEYMALRVAEYISNTFTKFITFVDRNGDTNLFIYDVKTDKYEYELKGTNIHLKDVDMSMYYRCRHTLGVEGKNIDTQTIETYDIPIKETDHIWVTQIMNKHTKHFTLLAAETEQQRKVMEKMMDKKKIADLELQVAKLKKELAYAKQNNAVNKTAA